MAQRIARWTSNPEAAGSNPVEDAQILKIIVKQKFQIQADLVSWITRMGRYLRNDKIS